MANKTTGSGQWTNMGNVTTNPLGSYSDSKTYNFLDMVSYEGGSYICLENETIGVRPSPGESTDRWFCSSVPGEATPDFKNLVTETKEAAKTAKEKATDAEVSAKNSNDSAMAASSAATLAIDAAKNAENSKDVVAGYKRAAEKAANDAASSKESVDTKIAGLDETFANKTNSSMQSINEAVDAKAEEIKTEINTTKQQAINTITNQQDASVNIVKTEGEKIITKVGNDAKTVADDRATVEEATQTVLNNAQEVAQNTQTVASNTEKAAVSAEGAKTSADNAAQSAKSVEDASKQIEQNKKDIDSLKEDIVNLSLTKHTDGKIYIKEQDGTLIGDGIEIGGSDVDLSKITISMSGQTLKLMNDGNQIATVEIPTATVTDAQLTSIIQSKIDDGTITNMTIPDDSITTKKLNIAPKVSNIITNPNFSDGTTGYTLTSATTVITNNSVEVTPTAQNGGISKRDIKFTIDHKIYVSALVKTNSSNVKLYVENPRLNNIEVYHSNNDEFERLSNIFTATNSYATHIKVINTSSDLVPFTVKSFICIDLTEAYGSGNEPDKEYMDEFLNGFNDGVVVGDGLQILGDMHIRNKRIDNLLPKMIKIDDTDENIMYYGTWTKETNSNYDNNSGHYSSDKDSYMEYTFMGTGINIYDVTGYT